MLLKSIFTPVYYLDPGTGSLLIQLLLAGVLGLGVAVKIYWKKIVSFFTKKNAVDTSDDFEDLDQFQSNKE